MKKNIKKIYPPPLNNNKKMAILPKEREKKCNPLPSSLKWKKIYKKMISLLNTERKITVSNPEDISFS